MRYICLFICLLSIISCDVRNSNRNKEADDNTDVLNDIKLRDLKSNKQINIDSMDLMLLNKSILSNQVNFEYDSYSSYKKIAQRDEKFISIKIQMNSSRKYEGRHNFLPSINVFTACDTCKIKFIATMDINFYNKPDISIYCLENYFDYKEKAIFVCYAALKDSDIKNKTLIISVNKGQNTVFEPTKILDIKNPG